jgi:hypothetical protein
MFFIVVVIHLFKRYLLEYFSFWFYSYSSPFGARVLCKSFVQFKSFSDARVVLLLSGLCMYILSTYTDHLTK